MGWASNHPDKSFFTLNGCQFREVCAVSDVDSNNSPEVVGLTLNFRDAKRTFQCVYSLLADGVSHVLVWDNSQDDARSAEELRVLLDNDVRVSIHISERNLGFAAGVNRGKAWLESSFPGGWILLINNDAVILAGATRILARALQTSARAVIAYPKIVHGEYCKGTVFYQRYFGLITDKRLPGSIAYASGCCQLLDPTHLSGPWFDESFFMYGEDTEFCYRLGERRMLFVPEVLVKHEGSTSSGMGSIFYENRMVAAHIILARKLAQNNIDLALLYTGRVFALSVRAILRAIRYRSWIPIKSLWSGLCLSESPKQRNE
jgi:N-acetylglucosaminyl-diphospho-decaprenol L-rhamnosyltransferase